MNHHDNIKRVVDSGLVAIVRAPSADEALATVEAIHAGGVSVIEVTMTVPGAIGVLEKLAAKLGSKVLLGAGTVLDPETARACILAGAEFLVSPNLNVKVIELTRRYSKVSVPAGLTPTEVVTAWEAGADFVKIFPCSAMGGADYIKALKAPLPQVAMIPTGGVSLENCGTFFKAGAAAVAVGGELVDKKAVAEKRWDAVTKTAQAFADAVRKARS
ncbi:MAG TPA: bifunctional 4-hydroxy-2-oxoglutarate aldolase/2-dehydro-3-deoxy-phosphogluconate aldolase [Planctomycetota bacterium]